MKELKIGQRWMVDNTDDHCPCGHCKYKFLVEIQENEFFYNKICIKIIQQFTIMPGFSIWKIYSTALITVPERCTCAHYLEWQDKI